MDEAGLGLALQRARQAAGLTQQELCHKAKLSYSTLAKIERGAIKSPSIFTVQKIGEALGLDFNQLLNLTSGKSSPSAKQRSRTGVRFVYFDVNGCLVRFFHKAFTKIASDTGADAETIETAFWHYNDSVCRGEISVKEFNAKLAKKIGVAKLDWESYYLSSVEAIPEMQDLVKWAVNYYHVGLMSNIMPGFIDALKKRGLIPDVSYTAIIDSSEVGAVKPEAKVYEIAQAKSGVGPEEILLIDDSRSNLMAADQLGWHVLWFDDYEPSESVPRIRSVLEPEHNSKG
jgi:FMN phosphatase YigB (HAD superfamily)